MILEIIVGVIITTSIIVNINLFRKNERLEDIIVDQQAYMVRIAEVIQESNNLIKTVDEKGIFESDDDIGGFFTYLKTIQAILDSYKVSLNDAQEDN